jgi:predicted permease
MPASALPSGATDKRANFRPPKIIPNFSRNSSFPVYMGLKHVLRRLLSSLTFTIVTVLTLAIGIGGNAAIFSVIEGILLKPLPYAHPDRLVAVEHRAPAVTGTDHDIGTAPFLYFTQREQGRTFQDVAAWTTDAVTITGLADPERVEVLDVTDGLLPILGVQPAAGRVFSAKDDSPGSPETVMLTYGYWQRKFGSDPSAVGKRILINGEAREIVGVLPKGFWFNDLKPAILMPMRFDRNKTFLGNFSYQSLARLKDGVTITQATADLARLMPVALNAFPPFPGYDRKMFEQAGLAPNLHPLKDYVVGDIGKVLWVLMGTIGMVLLIACANVANLLLVRAEGRQQELAIRVALGAGWGQLVRQLLMESLTLALLGGAAGLGLAYGGLRLLVALAPSNLPRLESIGIDSTVLLFTLGISLLAGLLFGIIPALKYAGPQLATALRSGGRTLSQSKERHRARNTLVVVQVALALVLLVCSGLMIRTFYSLRQVQPGFTHPETLETFRISIPQTQVADELQMVHMQQSIMEKVAAVPGVTSVGLTSNVPMTGSGWHDPIYAEDKQYLDSKIPPLRFFKFYSPGLLATMGNSLLAGRDFTWGDVYERRPVAMVSENLAREMWGSPSQALGKRIRENTTAEWREVVGVVNDVRDDGPNQKASTFVAWPIMMNKFGGDKIFIRRSMSFVVRSDRAGTQSLLSELRQAVWSLNGNLPLANASTLSEIANKSMARTSFTLVMLGIAGGMALLLGIVGIYGVISYSVSQRTREIGIRMALGAPLKKLTSMFVTHGLRLAAIGVAFGLAGAAALSRLMEGLLFEVRPVDPVTYGAVSLALVAAAMLASYLPALRAAAVDPVEALRAD